MSCGGAMKQFWSNSVSSRSPPNKTMMYDLVSATRHEANSPFSQTPSDHGYFFQSDWFIYVVIYIYNNIQSKSFLALGMLSCQGSEPPSRVVTQQEGGNGLVAQTTLGRLECRLERNKLSSDWFTSWGWKMSLFFNLWIWTEMCFMK